MTTPPPDKQPAAETLEEIAKKIAQGFYDRHSLISAATRNGLAAEILKALRDLQERCAQIADERAAFNRRLMRTHPIGDPIADLKSTRADEAEVIAGEIREGK